MNIWAEQARRLANELTMKSKIEIKQRNRDGAEDSLFMISLWFFNNILSCGYTKLQKCTTLNYCQKVVEKLLLIN